LLVIPGIKSADDLDMLKNLQENPCNTWIVIEKVYCIWRTTVTRVFYNSKPILACTWGTKLGGVLCYKWCCGISLNPDGSEDDILFDYESLLVSNDRENDPSVNEIIGENNNEDDMMREFMLIVLKINLSTKNWWKVNEFIEIE